MTTLSTNRPTLRNPGQGTQLVARYLARVGNRDPFHVWLELVEWVHEEGEPRWAEVVETTAVMAAIDAAPMTDSAFARLVRNADRDNVREHLLSAARCRAGNDTQGWADAIWRALDATRGDLA